MKKKTRTERSRRPIDCDGAEHCTNQHHRAYARLMDALVAIEEASEAIVDMPKPRHDSGPHPSWYFSERETHRVAVEEAEGLLWIVRHVAVSLQSLLYPCSHSERERGRMRKRLDRLAADPTVTVAELFADEDGKCSCRRSRKEPAKVTASA